MDSNLLWDQKVRPNLIECLEETRDYLEGKICCAGDSESGCNAGELSNHIMAIDRAIESLKVVNPHQHCKTALEIVEAVNPYLQIDPATGFLESSSQCVKRMAATINKLITYTSAKKARTKI